MMAPFLFCATLSLFRRQSTPHLANSVTHLSVFDKSARLVAGLFKYFFTPFQTSIFFFFFNVATKWFFCFFQSVLAWTVFRRKTKCGIEYIYIFLGPFWAYGNFWKIHLEWIKCKAYVSAMFRHFCAVACTNIRKTIVIQLCFCDYLTCDNEITSIDFVQSSENW